MDTRDLIILGMAVVVGCASPKALKPNEISLLERLVSQEQLPPSRMSFEQKINASTVAIESDEGGDRDFVFGHLGTHMGGGFVYSGSHDYERGDFVRVIVPRVGQRVQEMVVRYVDHENDLAISELKDRNTRDQLRVLFDGDPTFTIVGNDSYGGSFYVPRLTGVSGYPNKVSTTVMYIDRLTMTDLRKAEKVHESQGSIKYLFEPGEFQVHTQDNYQVPAFTRGPKDQLQLIGLATFIGSPIRTDDYNQVTQRYRRITDASPLIRALNSSINR